MNEQPPPASRLRYPVALLTIAMLLSACSVAQLGTNSDFDRLPLNDYLRGGDYSIPDDRAGGFLVSWFENPVRSAGYCRIVEVGGDSCRE